jgi:hypothetical protein
VSTVARTLNTVLKATDQLNVKICEFIRVG